MDVARLVRALQARGVSLHPEGDHIVLRGPRSELDSATIQLVAAHKPELLAYLRERAAMVASQVDALMRLHRIAAMEYLSRSGARLRESLPGLKLALVVPRAADEGLLHQALAVLGLECLPLIHEP